MIIEILRHIDLIWELKYRFVSARRRVLTLPLLLFFAFNELLGQVDFILSNNANVVLSPNATLRINGSLIINQDAELRQNNSGNIYITKSWTNEGTFLPSGGTVTFIGSSNSTIGGGSRTTFNILEIEKENTTDIVFLNQDVDVTGDLLLDKGTFRYDNSDSSKILTLSNDLFITANSVLDVSDSPARVHDLIVSGDIRNENIIDLRKTDGAVNTTFVSAGNVQVYGNGLTTDFNEIILNKGSQSDEVLVQSNVFTVPDGFLTLSIGTFHISGNYSLSNTVFKQSGGNYDIPGNGSFWLDNSNVSVTGQNATCNLSGKLRISTGEFNIGTGINQNHLLYNTGSEIIFEDGTINIGGRLSRNAVNAALNYQQSSGILSVGTLVESSAGDRGMFDIGDTNSSFTQSGGTIRIRRQSANTTGDYLVLAKNGSVTGGVLEINAADASQTIDINTTMPVYDFVIQAGNNPEVSLINNNLSILNDATFAGAGSNRFMQNQKSIFIAGDWNNNYSDANGFNGGTGTVIFNGTSDQYIQGSQITTFYHLTLDKDSGNVILKQNTTVDRNLRLLSSTLLDLNQRTLVVGESGNIYSDSGTEDIFSATKCIFNSDSSGNYEGVLERRVPQGTTSQVKLLFPIGTPGSSGNVYTPAEITLRENLVTFYANNYIRVKPIPKEHPRVDESNVSLWKYWVVSQNNISISDNGANCVFYYHGTEVRGNEGQYVVLLFKPSYPDSLGYWRVNPGGGGNDVVDFNNRLFYSAQVDFIDGDWLCGEESAAQSTYFARADGDYNNPSTWSKINFNGSPSTTAPNKQSDRVLIQDHTVTVSSAIPPANIIAVQKGTSGRASGVLRFSGDWAATGDTFRLEEDATIEISHVNGITTLSNDGNVRTNVRDFHENAWYKYIGTQDVQFTGDGIPLNLKALIVNKASGDTLQLSKNVTIKDSLVINSGALDIGSFSINGNSAGRTLVMYGGELIIRSTFPTNYTPPVFTSGRITFDGTGNATIPSAGSSPGVIQYYDLKISGTRTGNITLRSQGEIRISNIFDISDLTFSGPVSQRFLTDGSTVNFNRNGGIQNIPCKPLAPSDSIVNLSYYNLKISGSGLKQFSATGAPTFIVLNDITLSSSTFSLNNFNLEVQGDWINTGGIFQPNNRGVILRSPVLTFTNYVTSRSTTDNPFDDVLIAGDGIVRPLDNILVRGNLTIGGSSNLSLSSTTLTLQGNWINQGGTFSSNASSLVSFEGTSLQNMSKTSGDESFTNLKINNSLGVNVGNVGATSNNGVIITGTIDLTSGNLITRGRQTTVYGTILRPGANPGHIDGELRKIIDTASTTKYFEIGYLSSYTPVTLEFSGTGGSSGLVGVISDSITATSSPISTTGAALVPAGSNMSDTRNVRRQWTVSKPSGSSFDIGSQRTYNIMMQFINGVSPNGDLRNGALAKYFESRMWSGSSWIAPNRFDKPLTGLRTDTTITYRFHNSFGTFITGEPVQLSFYSISNNNWTVNTSWSTQSYDGPASDIMPTPDALVYIGNSHIITLNQDIANNGIVTIDSSGKLLCEDKVLSGSGEFRLTKDAALGIGNTAGITSAGASGNIQTNTRSYNYNSHNRAHLVYTGGLVQTSGNGVPANIATFTVDKSSNQVTLSTATTISDSLYIKSGGLTAGANITLNGNFRLDTLTTFTPGTFTITISGTSSQTFTDKNSGDLTLNNLTLNKGNNTGQLILNDNSPIRVNGTLTFSVSNKGIVDAISYPGNYVSALGTVTRTGEGHVNGEMRKNIPSGDAPEIVYEVGDTTFYTPFRIDFGNGPGSSAGQLGVRVYPGKHQYLDIIYNSPIDPERYLPRYWRLTVPSGSGFARGNRDFDVTLQFINPNDLGTVDAPGCLDMAYWKGILQGWQSLRPNTTDANFSGAGYICSDSRFILGEIDYDGSITTVKVNNVRYDTAFGSTETYSDGSLLLGDFVSGNQATDRVTTFFSRADGNWSDTNTWSTVSYFSSIKPDRFPQTQYDVVYVGNGRKVILDRNIGTGRLYSDERNDYFGPSTTVQNTGYLSFGHHILRGVAFTVEKGGTIEIGAADGFNTGSVSTEIGKGNILVDVRTYEDSINVIYTGIGYTPDNSLPPPNWLSYCNYCRPSWNAGTHWIERTTLSQGPTTLFDNNTGNTYRGTPAIFYYAPIQATLTAGNSYTITIDPNNVGSTNRHWTVWIDYDRDGVFEDNVERVVNQDFNANAPQSSNFTVPGDVLPGSTQMRVQMKLNSGAIASCSNGTGELEDYTIILVNDTTRVVQQTGNGLPDNLWSIQAHCTRASGSTINLGKSIRVRDSVKVISGEFKAGSNTIYLAGDFINDSLNGFNAGTGTVEFYLDKEQNIRGNQSTTFNNISINKTGGKVHHVKDALLANTMSFNTDSYFLVENNTTFTIASGGSVNSGAGSFSGFRMIQSTGASNAGTIVKQFTSAAGAKSFTFPVGVDTIFNPAEISVTGTYTGTPALELRLFSGLHPDRLSDNILSKYWNINTQNISNITANSLKFTYTPEDTNGNIARYIPALFKTDNNWEINVGLNPKGNPSPIEITNTLDFVGDWTAGEADGFFQGRIYYSRATGNWDIANNWSTVSHSGPPSSYYPGQLFVRDTSIIDGHNITFNVDSVKVDSVKIGGLFGSGDSRGILTFGTSPLEKRLYITGNLGISEDGVINGTNPGNRLDSLIIYKSLINNSSLDSSGGIILLADPNDFTVLKFYGSGNSEISGNGVWGNIAELVLNKSGQLADSLIVQSSSFADATVASPAQYIYHPESGVLKNLTDSTMSVSNGANEVVMNPFTGFDIVSGNIISKNSIVSNVNTTINISGSNLLIGDEPDEDLRYNTGTKLNISNGMLDIAGCFIRDESWSAVDLGITNAGIVRVLSEGSTDPLKIGFDITNASSTFTIDDGRIIISRGIPGSTADYIVNISNSAFTGGTIQAGDSLITLAGDIIKIAGTLPVWNLHCVGDSVYTYISEESFSINNNLTIDDIHNFQLRGNIVNLAGNLYNYGIFDAVSGSSSTDARLLSLNGNGNNQILFNEDVGGLDLYNLRIDKGGGVVRLGLSSGDNSIIKVRNTLEFSNDNLSNIDSRTNNLYVEVSPIGGSTPQILRNGQGHIDGLLNRYVETDNQMLIYVIGDSTLLGYRPAVFETVGSGGTAGNVGIILHPGNHPDIANSQVDTNTSVRNYWSLSKDGSFALGSRTYNLSTYFLNPDDHQPGVNIIYLEHVRYTPSWPAAGMWYSTITTIKSDTMLKSVGNTSFGDYIIGEPIGTTFYSIANGLWNDPNTWSNIGYGGPPASTWPQLSTDNVRIGDGKVVTIPDVITPTVRAVYIENYNNQPGELYINGNLGYVRGITFVLEDSCALGMMHLNGISPSGLVGAIQMDSRTFGVSRYIFNTIHGSQNTGKGLPDSVSAIIVDNPSAPTNSVFITQWAGASDIIVRDSILINRGTLNCGNRNLKLFGQMRLNNNGIFNPLSAEFTFQGTATHTLTLDNDSGATFNRCYLRNGGNIIVTRSIANGNVAHLYIKELLQYTDPAVISGRAANRKVVIKNGASLLRPMSGGYVDGILSKPVAAGAGSYLFEIGYGLNTYTPAFLSITGGGGTGGQIEAINLAPVPDDPDNGAFCGNRMDRNAHVPRYWRLELAEGFTIGGRLFNTNFKFPLSETSTFDLAKAVMRRRSIPTESPEWNERIASQLLWAAIDDTASVEIAAAEPFWPGIGEFYIGEKAKRKFFSRQNGNWNEANTWSFISHVGPPVCSGMWPNVNQYELEDNVQIGLTHDITLDTVRLVDSLEIINDSRLNLQTYTVNSTTGLGLFNLDNNAMLSYGGVNNPSITMNNFNSYNIGINSTIEFYGDNQNITPNPFSLDYGNVLVNQVGTKLVVSPVLVRSNLSIFNNAILNNGSSVSVMGNVINSANIYNSGLIEIGP